MLRDCSVPVLPWKALFLSAWLLACLPLGAQMSPSVVTEPWRREPHWAQTFDDILFLSKTDTKDLEEGTRTFYWNSYGRIKFDKNDPDPQYGILSYKVLTHETSSENGVLDGQLNDIALGTGARVDVGGDIRADLFGGGGTANDGHFSSSHTWYGMGAVGLTLPAEAERSLHTGIFYDGNRSLWPDIPLPYVTYQGTVSESCHFAVGVPESRISVRPSEAVLVDLRYSFPVSVDGTLECELTKGVRLFVLYSRALEGFWQGKANRRKLGISKGKRLFHELDRVGGGIRVITEWIDLSVGVGYAFNRRFRTGRDLRDLKTYRELDPTWLISFRVQGIFGW